MRTPRRTKPACLIDVRSFTKSDRGAGFACGRRLGQHVVVSARALGGWLTLATATAFASVAPHPVQHAEQNSPGAAFLSTTLPAASGAGNIVLVGVFHFAGGSVSSVTDSTGTSFQLVVSAVGAAGFAGATLAVYSGVVPASVAVPNAIVVTGPFPGYVEVVVSEYAGLPGAAADLTDITPPVVGAMSVAGPSMQAARDDLLFWWLACEGAVTGADGGFTLRANINGDIAADLVAPASGSYAPTAAGACNTAISALVRIPSRLVPVDAGVSDAGVNDAGSTDAGTFDAGTVDAGASDAGAVDAGAGDAGTADAGLFDAGQFDAGSFDAGATDAGSVDAGPTDAGLTDDAGLSLSDAGASDGGVFRREAYAVGCDCSAAPMGMLAFGALIALSRRRQTAR